MVRVRPFRHPLLHRYWILLEKTPPRVPRSGRWWIDGRVSWEPLGFGVTAFSLDDALWLMRKQLFEPYPVPDVVRVTRDIDMEWVYSTYREIRPPIWRGVWHPWIDHPWLGTFESKEPPVTPD